MKGKGKGWHHDRARHSVAAKKGWRNKSGDILTPHLSQRKITRMKARLKNLQRELDLLKKAKKDDTKTYEQKLDEAWELFSQLEKRGKLFE